MKMDLKKEKSKCSNSGTDTKEDRSDIVLSDIYKAIQEISHGSVQIHIQDGKVIQIDKINKVRMR